MAGNIENLECDTSRFDDVAFSQQPVRRGTNDRHAEWGTEIRMRILKHWRVPHADIKWSGRKCLFNGRIARNVVRMTIGIQDRCNRQALFIDRVKN